MKSARYKCGRRWARIGYCVHFTNDLRNYRHQPSARQQAASPPAAAAWAVLSSWCSEPDGSFWVSLTRDRRRGRLSEWDRRVPPARSLPSLVNHQRLIVIARSYSCHMWLTPARPPGRAKWRRPSVVVLVVVLPRSDFLILLTICRINGRPLVGRPCPVRSLDRPSASVPLLAPGPTNLHGILLLRRRWRRRRARYWALDGCVSISRWYLTQHGPVGRAGGRASR